MELSCEQRLAQIPKIIDEATFQRAVRFAAGSPEYLALELYLAKRAQGVPIETPAVRK